MIDLSNKEKIIICIISAIIISIIGYYIYINININEEESFIDSEEISNNLIYNDSNEEIKNKNEEKIIIHIAGCVENEGVYEINKDSRISDAINIAGGLTSDANTKSVNLAQKLSDGQKIYIPNINENVQEDNIETDLFEYSKLININTATQTQLETLPGIGPATANKIIEYRKENGEFKSIDDIKNVSGVGEVKFENIEDKICV